MDRKPANTLVTVVVLLAVFLYLVYEARHRVPQPSVDGPDGSYVHLAMGNPSGASSDTGSADNFLMQKPYYALSYNNTKGTPNWVSWCVHAGDFGPAPRSQFYPDSDLPSIFKHVTPRDYTDSGFDRGHMCPRSDRTSTTTAANATFAMTNIIPQAPAVNQKAWADLEDYCRLLVQRKHQTLYIIDGPQGQGGTGTKGQADTIARGKVVVPAQCWKVILVVDGGTGTSADVGRVGSDTRMIAVVMPNVQSTGHGWAKFRTSVREVERLTGYKFFDRVSAAVIEPLKDQVDDVHVPAPRSHKSEE
ncbi:DNA/RNA non-specific endonuclease [Fimbriiglobus ruber]|uniref:Sugar-non-specific nuclease NucA-like protein n=1 Tax=Fimbriiglobus ruber TaxID=1908690 RepID=A0A225EEL1_9BACT|nr:DNA/RNA non-specific endonuclease [Fimbriiglobus ruber]OWK46727.1 sugar-non-specific nuclease NucA-like protein [Fimbriiglobus ruber]